MIKGQTIWIHERNDPDSYAEFIGHFSVTTEEKVSLRLASSGHYAVYVNDMLISFGENADYPWYKLYCKKDLTRYCTQQNEIRIVVWHPGADSQTCIKTNPGLLFEIEQGDCVLLKSDETILGRKVLQYRNGYCKTITSQMGFSFYYDNTIENTLAFQASTVCSPMQSLHLRKTGSLTLGRRARTCYRNIKDGYLIDLGEETVGFLDLEFVSAKEQELLISYGEHLVDGQVPRIIAERDFSVEFRAKEGSNQYLHPFRRLAGRYLQVTCQYPLDITYIGLRPTYRRVVEQKHQFKDRELQKIYDVSVNTLRKCMHEHYEDCPWREQAMYALDSRNQMLCGYYAFRGHQYQRENLLFMAQGQRADGLLSLCFPAGIDIPIPFFSLAYFMQVNDYVMHTKDTGILKKVKPVLERILDAFRARQDQTGLLSNFPYPCWNFYEWSKGSDNGLEIGRTADTPYVKQYDLILNCMYVYVCRIYDELYGTCEASSSCNQVLAGIQSIFYNAESDLYRLSTKGDEYSQLGNCFAILVGLGSKDLAERIIRDERLIPVTLSMNTFYYDALLSVDDGYRKFVIEDIRRKYGKMLEAGATTFWETEAGWEDFGGAGSLCHGWSAIPAYYLPTCI